MLISNSPSIITGNPPNVSPKPVAPTGTEIVAPMGKYLKTSAPREEGAFPSKVILLRLLQSRKTTLPMRMTLLEIVTFVRL